MECNRDEAVRAKEIAETKFKEKDIVCAKKFALKAHKLCPGLEGISKMLATFEVYHAVENKVNGETDWYAVLGVSATADNETVKKQYRKLAFLLHPDKNKSIGANGAFYYVSEARRILSDKAKRMVYDKKRNVIVENQNISQQRRGLSTPNAKSSQNFMKTAVSNTRPPETTTNLSPSSVSTTSHPQRLDTFWTKCDHCKTHSEFLRRDLNSDVLCLICLKEFLAVEKGIPRDGSPICPSPLDFLKNVNKTTANLASSSVSTASHPPRLDTFWTSCDHCKNQFEYLRSHLDCKIVCVCCRKAFLSVEKGAPRDAHEKTKRGREDRSQRKNYSPRTVDSSANISNSASNVKIIDQVCATPTMERLAKKQKCLDDYGGNPMEQAVTGNERPFTGSFLVEEARKDIRVKSNEWSLAATAKAAGKEREKEVVTECDQSKLDKSVIEKEKVLKKVSPEILGAELDEDIPEPASFDVPDPDFHDFDEERTEKCFSGNQVWAAYDDENAMPRFYAFIHEITSLHPFKMSFSWLNSKTNSELAPLNWVSSGFSKTCGEFMVGQHEVGNTIEIFSHRVIWEKGKKQGVIRIFPTQGDIWAVYSNWSPDWDETTPRAVINKYEMVEVLDDYSPEQGVSVTPLVKVAGFKTVFRRHPGPTQVRSIPTEEMFRLSHQVPSRLLTGEEAENAPRGCLELDPAATPLELLEVTTEFNDVVDTAEQPVR